MNVDFIEILERGKFIEFPFPHWIVKDVFSSETLAEIEKVFPSSRDVYNRILKMNPKLGPYDQNTSYALQFEEARSSDNILTTIIKSWENQKESILDYISQHIPFKDQNSLNRIKLSSFARGDFRTASPVTVDGTTQLGPHIDSPSEIFAGLIYLKQDLDLSEGGNLEIYELNPSSPPKYSSRKRRIPKKYLTKVEDIPYEKNIGIFFISHMKGIHGISPRSITEFDRRLINLTIELPVDHELKMFDLDKIVDDKLSITTNTTRLTKIYNKISFLFNSKKKGKNRYGKYNWINSNDL
jgi:hypothetical protein